MSSRARVEQQPVTGGNAMLVFVGLGMAFLLFMAFLNVVKAGNLFNESNLLYVALVLYAGAGALYMGFGVTGIEKYVKVASLCTAAGFVANTLAAGHRWYIAGRPPFANLYEMLLSFVWTVALLTLVAEHKFKVRIIGSVTMPLAVVSVILMQLMPSEVRPLVPALQSTWLHIHVSLAMLSYAACALSFAVAMMFLIKDNMKTETFLVGTSAMLTLIYASMMVRFERWGGFSVIAYDLKNKQDMWLNDDSRLFLNIPDLGWIFVITLVVVATPLVLYTLARIQKNDSLLEYANQAVFVGILLQAVTLAAFIYKVKTGTYGSLDAEGLFPTSLAASPFILSGVVGGIMISLLYLLLLWRRPDLERMLPSADTLDRVTYKAIAIGFPLLTLMIAAGAYWANRAWGSYWSWDPKETWAAITWLVYAIYLHMRITRGMRGRWAAYFAIGGFAVVCFTFLGVTYLLPGLHAYA